MADQFFSYSGCEAKPVDMAVPPSAVLAVARLLGADITTPHRYQCSMQFHRTDDAFNAIQLSEFLFCQFGEFGSDCQMRRNLGDGFDTALNGGMRLNISCIDTATCRPTAPEINTVVVNGVNRYLLVRFCLRKLVMLSQYNPNLDAPWTHWKSESFPVRTAVRSQNVTICS